MPEHREWADQLYAIYTRGREARLMAAIVGEAGLAEADRRALGFAERFEHEFVRQGGTPPDPRRDDRPRLAAARDAAARGPDPPDRRGLGRAPPGSPDAMSAERLAPTRLNLIRAERRLERVRKGAALLRRKREALVSELFRLARPAADARAADRGRLAPGLSAAARRPGAAWPRRDSGRWPGRSGICEVEIESAQVWGVPVASIVARPPLDPDARRARGTAPGSRRARPRSGPRRSSSG